MTFFRCAVPRRTESFQGPVLVAALLLLSACNGLGEAMSAHTNVIARAAGKELRVEEAAEILASNPQIPPDPQVVRALADLWVDYTLLATAVAEDTTLAALDMATFVAPAREQLLVMRVGEQMIRPDTILDDAEVQRRWAVEGPGAEIRARHILLRTPSDATPAQRDSVRQQAEALRARAAGGESFDALAREHSQDPGSAARGGDLGFFSRGRMVQPFEEAAFELQPGEISPVVETPFGYHVIQVEERRQAELGPERDQFRQYLVSRAIDEAERVFLDSIAEMANIRIPSSAIEVVREVSSRPDRQLRGRQGERAVAVYDGGEYTVSEFARFIRTQPAQVQGAFASATEDQIQQGIRQLVQMELLLDYARAHGIQLTAEQEEEILTEARQMIRELVDATGFAEAARQGADPALLDAHVKALVQGIVTGEHPFIPLGRLGVSLRDLYSFEINDGAFSQVVNRLESIRATMPPAAPFQMEEPEMPGQPPLPTEPQLAPPVTPAPPETTSP
jgi:hypothetical protein